MITAEDVANAAMDTMGGPFGWEGSSDCSVTACDAFQRLTGLDLMVGLRGHYSTRSEALALIRSCGGFRVMWQVQAARCGLTRGLEATGQIGIITTDGLPGRTLGLCVRPGMWAAKSTNGAIFCAATVELSWNA